MQNKFRELIEYLSELKKQGLCLAFSGGIDSALLLFLCKKMDILAITFNSNFQTEEEINLTKELCKKYDVEQIILNIDILSNPLILNNPKNRCYICKKLLFSKVLETAKKHNKKYIIDGTNFDDLNTYRPGLKALEELGVISPLSKFKITKQEIRSYAKECGIEIYNKPSTPCLATRLPYGDLITSKKLKTILEGEKVLKSSGFNPCRLRLHNDIARIEIDKEQFSELILKKEDIIKALKPFDIKYITLDIEGFRSGSMD